MSRSFRTRPKDLIARDRMPRDRQGDILFPRIIIRKPRPGDCHPLNRRMIARAFEKLPLEYFYGLKEIELRARQGGIGEPFGSYSAYAKKIILYSVPGRLWKIKNPSEGLVAAVRRYHPEIREDETGIAVVWDSAFLLRMFFLSTLFHELGHHYTHQYKGKKKPPLDVRSKEFQADAQVVKLQKHVFGVRID